MLLGEAPVPREAGGLGTLTTRLLDKDPAKRPTAAEALAMIDGLELPREANGPVASAIPAPAASWPTRTENVPPPPPLTLQEQVPESRPGPGVPWNRKMLITCDAVLAAVVGTVPLPPTEHVLTEILDLQKANLAKALRPAVKTALQNDIASAEKALKALRADDPETYRQAVSKDKLKHLTELSDACFFNNLGS
ncbi:hypothetical protein [Nonomuraea wenchangensis]|uniref:hypothetical protein n=1 Tax=Nonomuraea wenchangensis TaxID=568860 RepID=UPI0033269952